MARLKTALVGLKGVGGQHLKALGDSARAQLVAVADLDVPYAQGVAAERGIRAYGDAGDLIASEDIDAIVLATPHHVHASMTLEALRANLHVFVEKPLAIRVSEGDQMVSEAAARGNILAVGHNYRSFPVNVKLKELLPQIGPVQRVLWQWLENRPESYYGRDIWRSTWRHAGGGVLMNQTSHDLDLLCWLFGPAAEVSAAIGNRGHRHEVEDTAIATIRFQSGALANVQLSTYSHRLNLRQIAGERGAIHIEDSVNANVQYPETFRLGLYDRPIAQIIAEEERMTAQPEPQWRDVDCRDIQSTTLLDSFIDACLDGGQPITDGASALHTLELINAIILAGVRKKVVSCPIDRAEYDALMDELSSGRVQIERL